jgi:hypothetical protein
MLNHDQSVELAKRWLTAKGCTLWMDWDITSDKDLHEAAEWMIISMNSLLDFYDTEVEEKSGW